MEKSNGISSLIFKQLQNDLTPEESKKLNDWINQSDINKEFFEDAIKPGDLFVEAKERDAADERIDTDAAWLKLFPHIPQQAQPAKLRMIRWLRHASVAAVLIIIAVVGIYLWQNRDAKKDLVDSGKEQPVTNDVQPANGAAVLVLDNGEQIILDSLGNGIVTTEAGKQINKQEGQLSYEGRGNKIVYNTLFTHKGKTTSLKLADGSLVWLNAESSITFPTEFAGNHRVVQVTGEAYFEVEKDPARPFIVQIIKAEKLASEVRVLGTHFNISAYDNESEIKATLLEGAIEVTKDNAKKLLAPGQQAVIIASEAKQSHIQVQDDVNTDQVMAWLNNDFYFKNDDLKTIMRQLARMYDITVKYEGNLPERTFSGQISRSRSLAYVLELLGQTNIHFTIEGNEVTIRP